MADIDFDELDKAVNDLMANVDASKRSAGLDDPEEKVVTIPNSNPSPVASRASSPATAGPSSAPASASAESTQTVETSPASTSAPQAPASPSLAVKRRGQFMDIVHPSRDMNTAKPVSRQGATIQPGNDVIAPSASQQPQPAAAQTVNEQPKPTVEEPQPTASAWPDPIDMANNAPVPEVAATPQVSLESNTEETPLVSPFLPDAKPEKRPLGNPLQVEDTAQNAPEATNKDELQTPATPEPTPAAVLPEEFSGDLMAVESRDLSSHPEQPSALPASVEQTKLESNEELLIPAVATPDPVEQQPQAPVVVPTQPPAGGSIAQQYTEQPSSGDQSNGSIYDTATYHQPIEPLAPVKKKTPTTVWIMVGIGLLLIGAIAGAAYFYFTR